MANQAVADNAGTDNNATSMGREFAHSQSFDYEK